MAAIKVIKSIRLDSKGVRVKMQMGVLCHYINDKEIWMARVPFIR